MDHPNVDLLISLTVEMKKDLQEMKMAAKNLSDIRQDIIEVKEKTAVNTTTLVEHARRSTASEERLTIQEDKLEKFEDVIKSVNSVGRFLVKSLKILALLATIGLTILAWYYHSA